MIGTEDTTIMVLLLDSNSEHVAQAWRKIGLVGEKKPICDCSRSNKTDQITEIAPYALTYFYLI